MKKQLKNTNYNKAIIYLSVEQYNKHIPLCFEAKSGGSTVTLNKIGTPAEISFEISFDNKSWETYVIGRTIELSNKVYFRNSSETDTTFSLNENDYYQFTITGAVSAVGDITSLLNKNFNVIQIPCEYCFYSLFKDCTGLKTVPFLRALVLNHYCYMNMFAGCTGLKNIPKLNPTTMKNHCYDRMFAGCTGLTRIAKDILPAMTLTTSCYQYMFQGCTNLINMPDLPAEYLFANCYFHMFEGCSSLTETSKLGAIYLALFCYSGMFDSCTSLEKAPDLDFPGFDVGSCGNMFNGCTNLKHIQCLVNSHNSDSTLNWVVGVAENGTFIKKAGVSWGTGESGIPQGWEILEK